MTDRELLELAAKAAGFVEPNRYLEKTKALLWLSESGFPATWSPLTDDKDALRLAVQLGMYLNIYTHSMHHTFAGVSGMSVEEPHGDDPEAATRRAIVRAAAEIGREK